MNKFANIVCNAHAYVNEFDKELDKMEEAHFGDEFSEALTADMHFATIKADYDFLSERFTDEEIAEMQEFVMDNL